MSEWKEVKVKTIGSYEVRKKRNSYELSRTKEDGKTERFSVWKTVQTDAGWEHNDINPFITSAQQDSQKRYNALAKKQYEISLHRVRQQFKKKTGRDIKSFELKKLIKRHAQNVVRSNEITTIIEECRKEGSTVLDKYNNCKIDTDVETGQTMCTLADGTKLLFDADMKEADTNLGLLPPDVSELELWEIYGEVVSTPTVQTTTVEKEKTDDTTNN